MAVVNIVYFIHDSIATQVRTRGFACV